MKIKTKVKETERKKKTKEKKNMYIKNVYEARASVNLWGTTKKF